jgi:hypothetical protein
MPMLDAFIPEDAMFKRAENRLLSRLTGVLSLSGSADPSDPGARSLAYVWLHRPARLPESCISDHPFPKRSAFMKPQAIERWQRIAASGSSQGLEHLLADNIVFQSPVVHTPQVGKAIASKYLAAAIASALNNGSFR